MTINQMAWVVSGISCLAIAVTGSSRVLSPVGQSVNQADVHMPTSIHTTEVIKSSHSQAAVSDHLVADNLLAQLPQATSVSALFTEFAKHQGTSALDFDRASVLPVVSGRLNSAYVTQLLADVSQQRVVRPVSEDLWHCPVNLQPPSESGVSLAPVTMHGCVVAYVADPVEAEQVSQQLERWLREPWINWEAIVPALSGDQVSIQLGQYRLLSLPPAVAAQFDCHPHQLITDWVNNIRSVAGASILPLAQAQEDMYAATETTYVADGVASWYGPDFHGRTTANGEIYNQYDLTAAHRSLPLGTLVRVTNRDNGRSVIVRINDRGPYVDEAHRIIDLSYEAAKILDSVGHGVIPVELVILEKTPAMQINPLDPHQTLTLEI